MAILLSILAFSQVIAEAGLEDAVVRSRGVNHRFLSTLFWFSFLISLIVALPIVSLSNQIAAFLGVQEVGRMLQVGILVVPLQSTAIIIVGILRRQRRFDLLLKVYLISESLACVAPLVLALEGYGVEALLAHLIGRSLFYSLFLFLVSGWLPAIDFRTKYLRLVLNFVTNKIYIKLLNTTERHIDNLLLASFASIQEIGFYSKSKSLVRSAQKLLHGTVGPVLLSFISRRSVDAKLRADVLAVYEIYIVTTLSAATVLVFGGEHIIFLVLGPDWISMTAYLKSWALLLLAMPLHKLSMVLITSTGRLTFISAQYSVFDPILVVGLILVGELGKPIYMVFVHGLFQSALALTSMVYVFKRFEFSRGEWIKLFDVLKIPLVILSAGAVGGGLLERELIGPNFGSFWMVVFWTVISACSIGFFCVLAKTPGSILLRKNLLSLGQK